MLLSECDDLKPGDWLVAECPVAHVMAASISELNEPWRAQFVLITVNLLKVVAHSKNDGIQRSRASSISEP
jgi:hypothetical protein